MYINGLTENLHSSLKRFAENIFLILTVTDAALSNSHLNNDLSKINDWTYKWKKSFNPDSAKAAHEVVFSQKKNNNVDYPPIKCDNVPGSISQKFSIKTKLKTKFP